jgi:microcystin-dependent protein
MAEPFLSEIRMMSFGFPPKGWALCDGQLLPINQNQALFSLLGTTYGGDGRVNFGLPNLQGRAPMHMGSAGQGSANHVLGELGGEQNHTLSGPELAQHNHAMLATGATAPTSATGLSPAPANTKALAQALASQGTNVPVAVQIYSLSAPNAALNAGTIGPIGGSQPHLNMQPFLTISFCIALQGIFPSQT